MAYWFAAFWIVTYWFVAYWFVTYWFAAYWFAVCRFLDAQVQTPFGRSKGIKCNHAGARHKGQAEHLVEKNKAPCATIYGIHLKFKAQADLDHSRMAHLNPDSLLVGS